MQFDECQTELMKLLADVEGQFPEDCAVTGAKPEGEWPPIYTYNGLQTAGKPTPLQCGGAIVA